MMKSWLAQANKTKAAKKKQRLEKDEQSALKRKECDGSNAPLVQTNSETMESSTSSISGQCVIIGGGNPLKLEKQNHLSG